MRDFPSRRRKVRDDAFGVVFFSGQRRAVIEILVQEIFDLPALGFDFGAERGKAVCVPTNVVQGFDSGLLQTRLRVGDQDRLTRRLKTRF